MKFRLPVAENILLSLEVTAAALAAVAAIHLTFDSGDTRGYLSLNLWIRNQNT